MRANCTHKGQTQTQFMYTSFMNTLRYPTYSCTRPSIFRLRLDWITSLETISFRELDIKRESYIRSVWYAECNNCNSVYIAQRYHLVCLLFWRLYRSKRTTMIHINTYFQPKELSLIGHKKSYVLIRRYVVYINRI